MGVRVRLGVCVCASVVGWVWVCLCVCGSAVGCMCVCGCVGECCWVGVNVWLGL